MTLLDPSLKAPALPPPRPTSAAEVKAAPKPTEAEPKPLELPTVEAVQAAFKALSSSKSLEISSFHDEGTGRYVVRVADRDSGRILIQTPPDDLLRFLASAPSLDPPPTLIDA
ncbi:MAG: hypothetical protein EA356_15575 [Geminicoccaceae bacterium]|nr:MAG: hypothetical protein EA356_15575 [Geminicoccaceae bacterium]